MNVTNKVDSVMNVPHAKITEELGITVRKVTMKSLVTYS
jgi:hypothetical protein